MKQLKGLDKKVPTRHSRAYFYFSVFFIFFSLPFVCTDDGYLKIKFPILSLCSK